MQRFRFITAYAVTLRVMFGYLLFTVFSFVRSTSVNERRKARLHTMNARRITKMILRLQGLYIKVGQLISILTNFLPERFRAELEELQDSIPPRPADDIVARIVAEFGKDPDELFATFNRQAIASASLAQVHEATLHDGRRVAVKVQHPNIEEIARRDLKTIRSILRLIGMVLGVRGLEEQYRQLEEMIREELDFKQEADNLEAIAANFANDPEIGFPAVVRELSRHRVLTTEFIDGMKITEDERIAALGIDRKGLAERIVTAYSKMIFVDGLYHADPHPGNIIVRNDGRIFFVDFGAVAHLSPAMQSGVPAFLGALIRRDPEGLRAALGVMGFIPRRDMESEAEEQLDRLHEQLFERLDFETMTLGEVNAESTMQMKMEALNDLRSLDISFRTLTSAFRIPKDWLLLERTALLLIGLCTHLDPTMQPLNTVRPYLEDYVFRNGGNLSDMLTQGLTDMVVTGLSLPQDLRKLLTTANKGKLEVRVRGLRERTNRLYALGRQLLYGGFLLASIAVAYVSHIRGDDAIQSWAIVACGLFTLLLIGSMIYARRWR